MKKYLCPICNRRACDSNKSLNLSKLSNSNEDSADIVIKCQNCKNTLAVNVTQQTFFIDCMGPCQRLIPSQ